MRVQGVGAWMLLGRHLPSDEAILADDESGGDTVDGEATLN